MKTIASLSDMAMAITIVTKWALVLMCVAIIGSRRSRIIFVDIEGRRINGQMYISINGLLLFLLFDKVEDVLS